MSSKTFLRLPSIALVLLTVLAACTVRPSAQDVLDRATPAICEKAKECTGELSFSTTYPGGVDECVTKTKAEVSKKYGDDLERSSVCTDEEVDKCLQDLKAAACPENSALPTIPCNC